jgi:(1->4)-alpha-D-glucan 1-alpha-D-glucosylmutase
MASTTTVARQAPVPRATYRLQLRRGFGFAAARDLVDYLDTLGVSHVYCSPILAATPGSSHGYDVVDHARISDELGGAAEFDALVSALRERGMGVIVDIVPNHMAISGGGNAWWWDVLEHGHASRYAAFFDVDWDPPESRLRNVILLPVLGDHYGRVLESGGIRIARDGTRLAVAVGERRFPLDPRSLGPLVTRAGAMGGSDELAFIGRALGELPPSTAADPAEIERRRADAAVLRARLEILVDVPRLAGALDRVIAEVNSNADELDRLLDEQNYRLAYWRSASRDLGYRRFFDIDSLIGLRVERPEVFEATHALICSLVEAGRIDGLRVDHPDGLRDPAGYFERLRGRAPRAWIVAEKVLVGDEPLRGGWPIDGDTGYRFADTATGLLVDPAGEEPLTRRYRRFVRDECSWADVATEARHEALSDALGSDLNRLAHLFVEVCEGHRRYRDFTRHELHGALREVAAGFGIYRTYVRPADGQPPGDRDPAAPAPEDAIAVEQAIAAARAARPDLDQDLFAFLRAILLLEVPDQRATELALRFQQLTPAAMAKGLEDTAFYRYVRFVARNEVGSEPDRLAIDPGAAHARLAAGAERWPRGMLATSTHDTKRSGDVRARLALLSEIPSAWGRAVSRFASAASAYRTRPGVPDRRDEYLLYQTLVGAWPIDADRVAAYARKAAREAKLHTSWTAPDADYEVALERFVRGCLADPSFTDEVQRFVEPLVEPGRTNALAQTLIKLAAPGVPDLYQGTELWDLSLVDPDNRRPVDYTRRRAALAELEDATLEQALAGADEGLPKLWLIVRALELRRRRPEALGAGASYTPLAAIGGRAAHLFAFERGDSVVAAVPRLALRLARTGGWSVTALPLPAGQWRNVLDGAAYTGTTPVPASRLLERFPVALLERTA